MPLTDAQKTQFVTDVTVTNAAEFAAAVAANDDGTIAAAYNALAVPDFFVFRSNVPPEDYTGANGIVWTEVDGLTVGKARIFEWMTGSLTKPLRLSDPNQRQGLSDAFSAAAPTTRANLIALGRRQARRGEKLLITSGAGTTANPATMGFEGTLTIRDVANALRGVSL